MTEIALNLADHALIVTWIELRAAFAALHLNEQSEVDRLHDIWRNSVIAPEWNVEPGKVYDERKPRGNENFKVIVNPMALAAWICEVSTKRGFPYSQRQALRIIMGAADFDW